jgi:hypothetical protein
LSSWREKYLSDLSIANVRVEREGRERERVERERDR